MKSQETAHLLRVRKARQADFTSLLSPSWIKHKGGQISFLRGLILGLSDNDLSFLLFLLQSRKDEFS